MAIEKKPGSAGGKKRILIVDDHPMMRQGLAQLIGDQPDLVVCGEAADAYETIEAIGTLKPDLVLADISLPGKNGIELIKDIQTIQPRLPVLVISMHDESLYAERVLRVGARGYIMKQEGGKKMMEATRQVLGGRIYVSDKMSARILEMFSGNRSEIDRSPIERLTDREFEVFQLLGEGRSTREIATQLHLSVKTVEVHRAHIKEKLSLKNAPELISFAARWVQTQSTA